MTVTTEPLPHHVGLPVVGGFSHEIYGPGGADGGADGGGIRHTDGVTICVESEFTAGTEGNTETTLLQILIDVKE